MAQVEDRRTNGVWQRLSKSEFVQRIKGIKNIKIIAVIFIIAIALIIYSTVSTASKDDGSAVNSYASEEEIRLAGILSNVSGAGDVQTMITSSDGKIVGVLVIAEGATNPLVRLRLVEAVSGALGVDDDIICVLAKNNQ